MQSCLTKFFKVHSTDSANGGQQYYDYLFQKQEAEEKERHRLLEIAKAEVCHSKSTHKSLKSPDKSQITTHHTHHHH